MSANNIPEFTNEFRAYEEGTDVFFGTMNIELPELATMTQTVKGIGLAGEIDAPVHGHFPSLETKFNWRTIEEQGIKLTGGKEIAAELYSDQQHFDHGENRNKHEQVRIVIRGRAKSYGLGKLEAGTATGSTTVIETHYIKIEVAGKVIREIDKYGYKDITNGVDALAAVRANLGMA